MAKHRVLNNGFSLMESMLTLFIVSLISFVVMIQMPSDSGSLVDREIENIRYFFHNAQISAIEKGERNVIFVYQVANEIMRINSDGTIEESIVLDQCTIKTNSMTRFSYLPNGDTNAFGTIRLNCSNRDVNFIFQIQKGRFRVEQ